MDWVPLALVVVVVGLFAVGIEHAGRERTRPYWDWDRQDAHDDARALAKFPDQAAVMAALAVYHSCGCQERWDLSPPCSMGCPTHPSGISGPMPPIEAWRARDVLKRKGLWK